MTVKIIKVSAMTCVSCEKRVEEALLAIPGISNPKADHSRRRASFHYHEDALDPEALAALTKAIELAVGKAGYGFGGFVTMPQGSRGLVLALAALLIGAFLLLNSLGIFSFLPDIDSSMGLGLVFVAGLLTSVHCVAMCGGIALSQQRPLPDGVPEPRGIKRLGASIGALPYHLGRVVSYTVLGGIVGALGSVLSFSDTGKAVVIAVASVFMLVMGLRMLGILKRFTTFRLPGLARFFSPKLITALRAKGPFFVGLLNGLMPCGPLQTMQLYALGTGSAALGAISMLVFSLGTVPLLFIFTALSSFFTATWKNRIMQASAVMVLFFGLVMAGRALELTGASGAVQTAFMKVVQASPFGANLPSGGSSANLSGSGSGGRSATGVNGSISAEILDGIQEVRFDLASSSYTPIVVQKGIPVRWTINASPEALNGCNGEIVVPGYNIRKKLLPGANVIEFTPGEGGIVNYSCWMGMITSTITVVDKLESVLGTGATTNTGAETNAFALEPLVPVEQGNRVEAQALGKAELKTEGGTTIQEVTIKVHAGAYSPSVAVLQRGIPVRFIFDVEELTGCNRIVDFPSYGGGLDLSRNTRTPLLPVEADFGFRCGMNMLQGSVRVVDDLKNTDLQSIKIALPAPGASCCGN